MKILGLNKRWPLILAGAGDMGLALCSYRGFNERGFSIEAVFDNDLMRIGKMIGRLEVLPMEKMPEMIKKIKARIGIIAVPATAAQNVANQMAKSGLQAILNFAPVTINVPDGIMIRNVDLPAKLEVLTFNLSLG